MDQLRKLAEEGNAVAQFAVGLMHLNGHGAMIGRLGIQGVEKDENEARRWFLASAEQGCAWAMFNYAMLCSSKEEKFRWLLKAANGGLADAQYALVGHYNNPHTGAQIIDIVEAYKWAMLAANQNHPCVVRTSQFAILEHRMSEEQISEAEARAASFKAHDSRF